MKARPGLRRVPSWILGIVFGLALLQILLEITADARHPEMATSNYAAEVLQLDGRHLFLNGSAVQSVLVFNVYEISLFLEKRSRFGRRNSGLSPEESPSLEVFEKRQR